jgi:hypothetical protein
MKQYDVVLDATLSVYEPDKIWRILTGDMKWKKE